jgi:predicted transcriptional regulator
VENMNSTEKIKEIEKTVNEMANEFVRGFNKIQRLIESIKEKE